jgi:hypothetical protein
MVYFKISARHYKPANAISTDTFAGGDQTVVETLADSSINTKTKLTERFPIHVVCYWIGNSVLIEKNPTFRCAMKITTKQVPELHSLCTAKINLCKIRRSTLPKSPDHTRTLYGN